jgi:integrase
MASIKQKKGSPYWWVKYRRSDGKIVEEKTPFRIGISQDRRAAMKLKAERSLDEADRKMAGKARGKWQDWVPEYLATRYAGRAKTLTAYQTRWANLGVYMDIHGLAHPRLFQRDDAFDYMSWRKQETKNGKTPNAKDGGNPNKSGLRQASHNTARMELKLLNLLFKEANRREYVTRNPLADLGIKREPAPEKPPLSDSQVVCIRRLLADGWPTWMSISFEVAVYTGCRLGETCVYLEDVWIDDVHPEKSTIGFRDPKGGVEGNKDFRVPLRAELIPLFQRLKKERPTPGARAYDALPPEGASKWWTPARPWHRLFRCSPELKGCTFHCTRVRFITAGAQANIPIAKMMRLVNHASELIHRIYQRLQVQDVGEDLSRIPLPPAATPTNK